MVVPLNGLGVLVSGHHLDLPVGEALVERAGNGGAAQVVGRELSKSRILAPAGDDPVDHPDTEGFVKDPGPVIHQRLKDERRFGVASLELPPVGVEAEIMTDGGMNFRRKWKASFATSLDGEDDEPAAVTPFDGGPPERAEFGDAKAQPKQRQQDGVIARAFHAVSVGTGEQSNGFPRRQGPTGDVLGERWRRDEFGQRGIERDVASSVKVIVKGPNGGELQIDGGGLLLAADEFVAPAGDDLGRDQPRVGPCEGKEFLENSRVGPPCVFGKRPSGEIGNRQGDVARGQRLEHRRCRNRPLILGNGGVRRLRRPGFIGFHHFSSVSSGIEKFPMRHCGLS